MGVAWNKNWYSHLKIFENEYDTNWIGKLTRQEYKTFIEK